MKKRSQPIEKNQIKDGSGVELSQLGDLSLSGKSNDEDNHKSNSDLDLKNDVRDEGNLTKDLAKLVESLMNCCDEGQ